MTRSSTNLFPRNQRGTTTWWEANRECSSSALKISRSCRGRRISYGSFHDGDSYIVLNGIRVQIAANQQEEIQEKDNKLVHVIFFWLGSHTYQSKREQQRISQSSWMNSSTEQRRSIESCNHRPVMLFPLYSRA